MHNGYQLSIDGEVIHVMRLTNAQAIMRAAKAQGHKVSGIADGVTGMPLSRKDRNATERVLDSIAR